jgi:hypothetical protein
MTFKSEVMRTNNRWDSTLRKKADRIPDAPESILIPTGKQ